MGNILDAGRNWFDRSRGRILIALVIIVGLYFVVAFGEQAWKARELEAEVAERQQINQELIEHRDELQAQLEEYTSERYLDYVERSARRDLNLSNPGETVLLVRWLEEPAPTPIDDIEDAPAIDAPNWQKWLQLFGVDGG